MPKRPRAHQLEDISIVKFRCLLPAAWVCREKDRDYGIDLEVELFGDGGSSTGLTFNAQLKATDSATLERSVQIKTDRLQYLCSLDVPAILVRYCHSTDAVFWTWVFNAMLQVDPTRDSCTIKFFDSDRWDTHTPDEIRDALKSLRVLLSANRRKHIFLNVNDMSTGGRYLFTGGQATSQLLEIATFRIFSIFNERLRR